MSDLQHFVINRIGPRTARDLSSASELPVESKRPKPRDPAERTRRREVERLVSAAGALSGPELAACMVHDRYRFRMSVYQQPAGAAVRLIFDDDFDRQLYLWAYRQLDTDGVPSPVHGALLEILARRHLDERARGYLSGAWQLWNESRRPRQPEPRRMRR